MAITLRWRQPTFPTGVGGPVYPDDIAVPGSQYSTISLSMPGYKTSVAIPGLQTNLVRVTNDATRHAYSTQQCWNADMTRLMLTFTGPYYLIDTSDYSILDSAFSKSGDHLVFFDPVDPQSLWADTGNRIKKYTIGSGTPTINHQFTAYDSVSIGVGEGSISNDGRYLAVLGQKSSGKYDVFVYDSVGDTIRSTLNLDSYAAGSLDNCHISQSGKYVVIAWTATSGHEGHRVYDASDMSFIYHYSTFTGHMDIGFRSNGDEVMVRADGSKNLVSVRLSDGNARTEIAGAQMTWAYHISCRNIKRPGYAYISFFDTNDTGAYLYKEIFAAKLDASGTINRFSQSFRSGAGGYSHQAHACASPDGSKVIFASDFGSSGGTAYPFIAGVGA